MFDSEEEHDGFMDPEQRAKALAMECMQLTAGIMTSTDEEEVNDLKLRLKEQTTKLATLADEDPNEILEEIERLCEEQMRLIDEGLAEEVKKAMIIAAVEAEEEFQQMQQQLGEDASARERYAERMQGVSRDGEQKGGELRDKDEGNEGDGDSDQEPSEENGEGEGTRRADSLERKVDPDVLDGLPTTIAN